jgi:hypothetical protein
VNVEAPPIDAIIPIGSTQVGLAEAQYIKVARALTVLMHTYLEKGSISLKD